MTDDKMRFREILDEEIAVARETWNDLETKSDMIKRGALAAMSRAYELDRGVDERAVIRAANALSELGFWVKIGAVRAAFSPPSPTPRSRVNE